MGHNPFYLGLGFQPLSPIDAAIAFATTKAYSNHIQSEADRAKKFIDHIQHIHQ